MHAHWAHVGRGAAGLGAARGIGRFAYTPILPLMTTQVALAPQAAGAVSTANYVGYLAGALAGTASPRLARSTVVAGSAGRTGDHPGCNAAAAQHNWMAVVADSRGIRQRGGVRDCGQLDAGSPAATPTRLGRPHSWSRRSNRIRQAGWAAAPGSSSGWPLSRRRHCGRGCARAGRNRPCSRERRFCRRSESHCPPWLRGRRGPHRSSPVWGHLHRDQHDHPGSRTPARIPRRRGVAD